MSSHQKLRPILETNPSLGPCAFNAHGSDAYQTSSPLQSNSSPFANSNTWLYTREHGKFISLKRYISLKFLSSLSALSTNSKEWMTIGQAKFTMCKYFLGITDISISKECKHVIDKNLHVYRCHKTFHLLDTKLSWTFKNHSKLRLFSVWIMKDLHYKGF